MDTETIHAIAKQFFEAERNLKPIRPITEIYGEMTLDDAYHIQLAAVEMKQKAGQYIIGKKVGLTNKTVQKNRGINEPDYGHIMNTSIHEEDVPLKVSELITDPFLEAEIAFVLKKNLNGNDVTIEEVIDATDYIVPAIEIVERRCFPLSKTIQDTICDNAACGRIILGNNKKKIDSIPDISTIGLKIEKNGEIVDHSCSAAVLGSPIESLIWLAKKLSEFGCGLYEGEIVMTGSIGVMHPVLPGDSFTAHYGDGLGSVSVTFEE